MKRRRGDLDFASIVLLGLMAFLVIWETVTS